MKVESAQKKTNNLCSNSARKPEKWSKLNKTQKKKKKFTGNVGIIIERILLYKHFPYF